MLRIPKGKPRSKLRGCIAKKEGEEEVEEEEKEEEK
jgi:hypothetical protein